MDPVPPEPDEHHDVVIIGAGPAGLSCALECFDIQLDTVVLEADAELGGQVREIPFRVRNVAAGIFDDGRSLQAAMEQSATILQDRVRRSCPVTAADLSNGTVEAGGRRLAAKAILIASGAAKQELPVAVDGAFHSDVTYQLESDPDRFVGRHVVVVGGGDSATLDALALARDGSRVTLVHRSARLTARLDIVAQVRSDPRIEVLSGWEVVAINGDDRLREVVVARSATGERRRLEAGGLVVKISRLPRTGILHGRLQVDHAGALVVGGDLQTSQAGVFAAGDVVSGAYWRIAAAFGQGSVAARSILRYVEART